MHLIYVDESGNTGNNLNDPNQPVFVLCAMVVAETRWQALEAALNAHASTIFPADANPYKPHEVHACDLRTGRGLFANKPVIERIACRDAWMKIAADHDVKVIYRAIEKKRYRQWLISSFGNGISINPHVVAFALLSRVVDDYLLLLPGKPRGIFIFDENKEVLADVEKSIRLLRGEKGTIRLKQIVEKGFFIQSNKSLPLQLCDLFALSLRKKEEIKLGGLPRPFDATGIDLVEPLLVSGNERHETVLKWLSLDTVFGAKKERPGDKPGVG